MPLGMWTRVGPMNHILYGGSDLSTGRVTFGAYFGTHWRTCGNIYYIYVHKVDAQGINIQWRA